MIQKQAGHYHKIVVLDFILTCSVIFSPFTNSARLYQVRFQVEYIVSLTCETSVLK